MKSHCVLSFAKIGIAIMLLQSSVIDAHEPTRRAYDAALDPREAVDLQSKSKLAAAAAAIPGAALCQLKLRLLDSATGKQLAGLVRVTQADGRVLTLPGLVNRGIKLRNDHPAKDWYAVVEPVSVPVPQGRFVVEAFSGLQTERLQVSADLTGKASAKLDLRLKTFARLEQDRWFGGNTHLHLSGLARDQADEYLRTLPRADDLDFVFVSHLERVRADRDYISNDYTRADLEQLGGPGLIFGNGEEHRHNFEGFGEGYGHVMFLNIRELVRPVSIGSGIMGQGPDWPPLRRGISQARNGGATVIWCHNTFGREDIPDWLAGLLHAENIFDGDASTHGSYEDTFYRYLNIGLKAPFSTGTDWFIYDFSRVYARVDRPLTVESWLAALRAGRTFISNGPLLDFRINRANIGDTISLSKPSKLSISGRGIGRQNFKGLEVIHNGKVLHAVTTESKAGHFEARLEMSVSANEPGWFGLRVPVDNLKNEMDERIFAHTSPIYLEVRGRNIFQKETAESLIKEMESALVDIPAKAKFETDKQREEILQIYRTGIQALKQRLDR